MSLHISQILGAVVGSLGSDARVGGPQANTYLRYVTGMVEQALARWTAVSSSGVRCNLEVHLPDGGKGICGHPAIAACCVCRKPVCLDHAMVSPAEVICASCVIVAKARFAARPQASAEDRGRPFGFVDPNDAPPPPPSGDQAANHDERKAALRVLRLKLSATDEEIRAAYKKLAFEHHPDRAKTDRDRATKQRRLNEINRAYATLTKQKKAA
jgi:hypothetical protein